MALETIGLKGKMLGAMAVSNLLTIANMLGCGFFVIQENLFKLAEDLQSMRMNMAWEMLHQEGAISLRDGNLYAGNTRLDGNEQLVDRIQKVSGGTATIFRGDTRVATNVRKADGTRALGTALAKGPVYDAIFRDGKPFRGEAKVLGKDFFTAYDPIVDPSGKAIGILYVGTPKDDIFRMVGDIARRIGLVTILMVGLSSWGFFVMVKHLIVRPLLGMIPVIEAVGEGDLTQRLRLARGDEIGKISALLDRVFERMQGMIREIKEDAHALDEAASELSAISEQMSSASVGMSNKFAHVSSAAAGVSENMAALSATTTQSSGNVSAVAAAAEEMTTSVSVIAQDTQQARQTTQEAVEQVDQAAGRMNELGQAAAEITEVIEVILEIAEQTKLLALNATIEAARAGEAGKGFAVVANEVKELAKQTNHATEEIRRKIEGMQASTELSIGEIRQVHQRIHGISEVIGTTSLAVSEQALVTSEIAQNIGQTATGIEEITSHVADSAQTIAATASDLAELNQTCAEIQQAGGQVRANALELAEMGGGLRRMIERFKV
ncbi:MAG: methyl-accepting chemotaxis protein [Bacteroidota bacterium]